MTVRAFVDTNVVVYLFDSDEPRKQRQARQVFSALEFDLVLSPQVLSEFYVTVTRKLARPLTGAAARQAMDLLAEYPLVPIDGDLVKAAVVTSQDAQLSYWDALIVESAVAAGCHVLLTEDLSAGTTIRGVEVRSPFLGESDRPG